MIKVLVAASGTGGHLFPALHIATAFKQTVPDCALEFIGSGRPLESLIEEGGFRRHVVRVGGIKQKGIAGLIKYFAALPRNALETWRIISNLRPNVIVGVGGYVTFLPIVLGRFRGIPTWIHEAELKPGLANFFLSFISNRVSTAFASARMPTKHNVVYTGHPVRPELAALKKSFPQRPEKILILGGSQGAESLDRAFIELKRFIAAHKLKVWHQCRPENVDLLKAAYAESDLPADVQPFVKDMCAAYEWADILVCRSGAGTIMEVNVVNIPAVFVPYPFAQGNHQLANANVLVKQGKALLVEEGEDFTARLKVALESLLKPEFYSAMWQKESAGRNIDAAEKIVRGCLELARYTNQQTP